MRTNRNSTPLHTTVAAACSAVLLAAAAAPTFAQEAEKEELGEVIVTGSRVEKSVDKIPGAVTVIGEQELAHTAALTMDASAVLSRTVPGYAESSQAMSNTGENLRGRIALRLFDGVPQGSPLREGTRNATFTDMGVISRIEVINGPSASEGIGATGGIINYISASPTEDGTTVRLTSRYTSQFEDDSEGWKLGFNVSHRNENYDVILAAAFLDRGITYDGEGRRIGMNTSGSVADSEADNLFLKVGFNFGADDNQRVQATLSRFNITGKGNYILVDGDRFSDPPLTNTAEEGQPLGAKTEFNDFTQETLSYTHSDLFGGTLYLNAYHADQDMRFVAENGIDKQDPLFNDRFIFDANGFVLEPYPLIEQSEIKSSKKGLRTSWTRPGLFAVEGLELQVGLDIVEDTAQQRLALTDRLWVPPMEYTSTAPFLQASFDIGPVTITAGVREEDGELEVDDYVTVWNRDRRPVTGGKLSYSETLPNVGLIWRLPMGFSVFGAYGKGFTLPNVGIPLRNQQCNNDTSETGVPFGGTQPDGCPNDPPQTVEGILDLQAVVSDNTEFGFNWRGARGSFGGSYYMSDSDFGSTLFVDPILQDLNLARRPVEIEGYEFTGEYRVTDDIRLSALYSHTEGMTRGSNCPAPPAACPLNREMGIFDINPDKLGLTVHWQFSDAGDLTVGSTTLFDRDINVGNPAGGEEHTNGYTLVDFSVNHQLGKGTMTLGVENALDKFYILSWNQVDFFRNYFAGRGRVVSLIYTIDL
ncbi:MAG: TonB-dependent receptor [Steroidobacteraceae bacterium]